MQNPGNWGGGRVQSLLRGTVLPLSLIIACPPTVMLLWYTHVHLGGSLGELLRLIARNGLFDTVRDIWGPLLWGSKIAWKMIGLFVLLQLVLLKIMPGPYVQGPVTPTGHVPVYRDNGVLSFATTIWLFTLCSFRLHLFSPGILYDHFGELLGSMNLFSLGFCLMLYLKGRFAPSTADHGLTGSPVFDYYWGTELYPRILGWDVKRFTNCRFGMMAWPLLLISFAAKQQQVVGLSDSMLVAVGIQLLYISKFFIWETGYLRSLDIMHDRAGFYICWGCLVWLPCVYTSPTLYLVNHPNHLGAPLFALIFILGTASVLMNYLADRQRQRVRATAGKVKVWGRDPVLLVAHYTTEQGERKESLLLCSGYWGLARHFHYVPEILGAFFWSVPALFHHVLAYFYVIFLTILLTDRAFRDDKRCAAKYGEDWEAYKKRVPYRIIPGLL